MTLPPGKKLGRYEISGPLGSGGMGEVYRARDERLGREVAIKVLPAAIADDPERLQRFEREARSASALNHPGILTVYDFGREAGITYLVTELLEGESLRARLHRGGIPAKEALQLVAQAARALAAAHAKGIIHRDLKPENLFLTHDGRIKILDFGLALQVTQAGTVDTVANATTIERLTEPGLVFGTVGYMAPEQARGQAVDGRADLFALGCVLFEMLTGQPAFKRGSTVDTLKAILDDDPLVAPAAAEIMGEDAERVLRHCLEKNPGQRFQSASDAAFALESLGAPSGARRSSLDVAHPRRRSRWVVASLTAAGLIAVAAIAWLVLGRRTTVGTAPASVRSIAVLPFVNEVGDASLDYLSDGIAEDLISRLSPLEGLEVLARTTAFRFKGDDVDPLQVGRTLKVNAVVAGHVEVVDGRVLIGAELVDVASGAQLWGERFNRPFADLFDIEEDVARQIGERLSARLGKVDRARLGTRPTTSDEAYRLYLQGRHLWYERTREGVTKSIELFRTAVELDPKFALAWNGLGDAYTVGWAGYHDLPLEEAYTRGESAVRRALELDDHLAEAHTSLAFLLFERKWDWAGAEREFQRALALDPGNAYTYQAYGEYLYCMGRFEESLARLERARELDPLSEIVASVIGWSYMASGKTEQAIEQFRAVLERQPGFMDSQAGLTAAILATPRPEAERAASILDLASVTEFDPEGLNLLNKGYREGGFQGLLGALHEIQVDAPAGDWLLSPLFKMWVDGHLGRMHESIETLEEMYAERSPGMSYVNVGPFFDPIRSEPRFKEILAAMNFPDPPSGR